MVESTKSPQLQLLLFLLILISTVCVDQGFARQNVLVQDETGDKVDVQLPGNATSLTHSELGKRITDRLRGNGYLNAAVDSITEKNDSLRLFVKSGCRFTLDQLSVEENSQPGLTELPAFLSSTAFTGEPFTVQLLEQISAIWLAYYEQEGFMLAEFQIDSVEIIHDECGIAVFATTDPGERLTVSGVRFSGNQQNSSAFLKNLSGIRSGDPITPDLLVRGRRNLINSGLFDEVSGGELALAGGDAIVLYSVEEQQLNFFDGLIGYVPDAAGSGNIAGYGDILLRNTIAEGNLIDLRYEQLQPLVSKLNVRAEQHYVAGLPIRFGAGFRFTQQDSSYLVRNMELSGGYRIFPGGELTGGVRGERSSVSEEAAGMETINSRANFYSIGFLFRNTDRFLTPTRGVVAEFEIERGRRFLSDERFDAEINGSYSQTIADAAVRGYISVSRNIILSPTLNVMHIDSENFLVTDLFRFGGAESFRGFREDQFRASSVAWGDLETRYLIDRDSYLFLFGAYGAFERPQLLTESSPQFIRKESLFSTGFGLAFDSPLGQVKFTYAVSPNEDLGNGKVHVGIKTGI